MCSSSGPRAAAWADVSVTAATAPESWSIQQVWKTEEVG